MQIDRNNIDELTARLTVTVEPADYASRVEKILNDYRKNSQYPGFRKGKAPMALIRKQYATPVLADEMNKIISEELSAYIQKEELDILGNPIPETSTEASGDWEKPENFTFAYEIGLAPSIDLKFGRGAKFTRHIIKVDKKALEAAITDHKRRHGTISEHEVASDTDLLLGHFIQLDGNNEPLEGGIESDSNIALEHLDDKKTKKQLTGAKVGDAFDVNPHKVSHGHDDLAKMLGVTHSEVHDIKTNFRFEVKEIKRLTPHENNQALWDKVLGKDVVNSEKDFREKVSEELHQQFDRDAEQIFRRRFVVDLIEHMKIQMPDAFLKRWIQMNNENPLTDEQLEKEYPSYADSMRWQLLQQAVMKDADMRVTMEEVEEEAKRVIGAQYAQYGMPLEGEMLDNFAKNALSNEEERRRIADIVIERKVVDNLLPRVTIKEKSVSFEEFAKVAASVR
ncbi:MAG: trigger factor [Flavobacteriales bacterium]